MGRRSENGLGGNQKLGAEESHLYARRPVFEERKLRQLVRGC